MEHPICSDYVALFSRYDTDFSSAYLEPEDERYRFLFDQLLRLLILPSQFNLSLPQPFRDTAHKYLANDSETVKHMQIPQNRHFMLSDVFDYIDLMRRAGAK